MPLGTFLNGRAPINLRGAAFLSLSETGHVQGGSVTDDGGGGGTTTWSNSGTIACRVDPLAGDENLVAGRLSDRSTHVLTVPPNTSLTVAKRFVVDNRGTFEITALRDRTAQWLERFEAVEL